MTNQNLASLTAQGLAAMKAGSAIAMAASAEIERDAIDADLKAALQEGSKTAEQWAQRIERALAETGGAEDVGNPVIQAHTETSRQIRQKAPDDLTRDVGIIAGGQLALHYWIASFGTMRTYASALGLSRMEKDMETSLDEAKDFDEAHTALAKKLLDVPEKFSLSNLLPGKAAERQAA